MSIPFPLKKGYSHWAEFFQILKNKHNHFLHVLILTYIMRLQTHSLLLPAQSPAACNATLAVDVMLLPGQLVEHTFTWDHSLSGDHKTTPKL